MGDGDPRRALHISPPLAMSPVGYARSQLLLLPFQIVGFEQDLLQVGCPHHRERHDREGKGWMWMALWSAWGVAVDPRDQSTREWQWTGCGGDRACQPQLL